jgi:DNA-binding winged helix-turn-helix (wHTH) protein/predicted ATPase
MPRNTQTAFGEFRFDPVNECVWRGSQAIALRPKAFGVLKYLLERPGQLVVKQELLDAVWTGTFVGDAVLKDSVRQLREALGDDAASPRYIETAHRRGYRFIADLRSDTAMRTLVAEPGGNALAFDTPPASVTSETSRVLGRDVSLNRLRECLAHALRGERQLVFVTGEPGIGKTALVESFLERITATRSVLTARGQCLEHYGAGEAYLPVLDALTRVCRSNDGARIVDLLRHHAPTWLTQMPSLVPTEERESLRRDTLGATRERMLREIADALDALTSDTPLVLVLEDLHWSDYSTLDLISYVARRREPARLLLIGTYRPVDVILSEHPLKGVKRELQAHGLCRELPLEYLSEQIVAEYLSMRFPGQEFPALLARMIHRRTEGNPLFMLNVVNYLQDQQVIVKRDGRWRLSGSLADVERGVPENIRQLIEKQIERLDPDEQRVLEGASVVGMECSTVAIAAGLDADPAWVEARCEELVRRHHFLLPARLVELPDGTITPRYQFVHVLYLEVPYARIPALRRAGIHRRISQAGEAIYGDRVSEIAAELAMHFEQARVWPRAAAYLLMATENATQRFAHHDAAALARRGLDALTNLPRDPERDKQELALLLLLGSSLMAVNSLADPEAEAIYLRARELSPCASAEQFSIVWSLGLLSYFRADMPHALGLADQLLELATALQDPALIMEAHRALGVVQVETGEFDAALKHLDETATLYRATRQHPHILRTAYDTFVVSEVYAARALWSQGFPDQALRRANEGLRVAEQHPHAESRVIAAYCVSHLHQLRREPAAARDLAERLIAVAEEYGLELWKSFGVICRGWSMAEQGDIDAGIEQMRRGLTFSETTGAKLWRPHWQGLLAAALAKAGQLDEALTMIAEAIAASHTAGERYSQPELYRIKGDVLIAKGGDPREAVACFDEALTIARRQRSNAWELRVLTSMARLASTPREHTRVRKMMHDVLGRFTEGLDTADVTEARALIGGGINHPARL